MEDMNMNEMVTLEETEAATIPTIEAEGGNKLANLAAGAAGVAGVIVLWELGKRGAKKVYKFVTSKFGKKSKEEPTEGGLGDTEEIEIVEEN